MVTPSFTGVDYQNKHTPLTKLLPNKVEEHSSEESQCLNKMNFNVLRNLTHPYMND